METLYAYLLLSSAGLLPWSAYAERLHAAFLAQPDNGLLLELEWETADPLRSAALFWGWWSERWGDFDPAAFGKCLSRELGRLCPPELEALRRFGEKTYGLWGLLPGWLAEAEPFCALSYADDPLSWGDEAQARAIYGEFFRFYEDGTAAGEPH